MTTTATPADDPAADHSHYRPEIDGLRAVAVIAVVLYHAFPAWLPGGFVGVDVFFVISGYVITATVLRRRAAGAFTYRDFYARRIRRLFPALLTVLAASLAFGWFALLADEYRLLGKHAAAASAFIPNVVLWLGTGYFDPLAEARPLLHLWSLGVEEQFYFLWPTALALALVRPRAFALVLLIIGGASLAASLRLTGPYPSFAFYLPFTRFWELLAGAALVVIERRGTTTSAQMGAAMAVAGLALIVGTTLFLDDDAAFPGWRAIPPVLGAMLTIAGARATAGLGRLLAWSPVKQVGVISYPLYLWHWPLLSFLGIVEMQSAGWRLRLPAVILAVALAVATHRWIERPFRFRMPRRIAVGTLATAMVAIGTAGAAIMWADGAPRRHAGKRYADTAQLEWPYWRNAACEGRYPYAGSTHGWWFCMTSRDAAPTVLLLGNSFANHLYPGLVGHPSFARDTILSIGTCDPATGLTWRTPNYGEDHPCHGVYGERQERFIDGVIAKHPSLRLAILSSAWPNFGGGGKLLGADGKPQGSVVDRRASSGVMLGDYVTGLERRIETLQRRRIGIILILPKPELDYDVRACLDRPFHAAVRTCEVNRAAALNRQSVMRSAMIALAGRMRVRTVDPYAVFCDARTCRYSDGQVPLLRDIGHFSVAGSRRMADAIAGAVD